MNVLCTRKFVKLNLCDKSALVIVNVKVLVNRHWILLYSTDYRDRQSVASSFCTPAETLTIRFAGWSTAIFGHLRHLTVCSKYAKHNKLFLKKNLNKSYGDANFEFTDSLWDESCGSIFKTGIRFSARRIWIYRQKQMSRVRITLSETTCHWNKLIQMDFIKYLFVENNLIVMLHLPQHKLLYNTEQLRWNSLEVLMEVPSNSKTREHVVVDECRAKVRKYA